MKNGFYWLRLEQQDPEVVEIDGESMYRSGSDVVCRLENGKWTEFGDVLDVVELIGPLSPPGARIEKIKQITIDGVPIAEISDEYSVFLKKMAENGLGYVPGDGKVYSVPCVVGEDIGISLLIAFKSNKGSAD